jgi:hypothetical protein
MRLAVCGALAFVGVSLLVAAPAAAQVEGLPVYNGGISTGLLINAEVGLPNAAAGKGTAFGGSGRLGFGPLGVTATVASYNPKGPGSSITSVGATLNYKIFGGPLVPFSITLQGGAGYWSVPSSTLLNSSSSSIKVWHFPVGVGIGTTLPNPAFAIHPWVAPRLDVTRTSLGGSSSTSTHFAFSAGIDLNTITGLGLGLSYDWMSVNGAHPAVFGAGVHYALRVPGL